MCSPDGKGINVELFVQCSRAIKSRFEWVWWVRIKSWSDVLLMQMRDELPVFSLPALDTMYFLACAITIVIWSPCVAQVSDALSSFSATCHLQFNLHIVFHWPSKDFEALAVSTLQIFLHFWEVTSSQSTDTLLTVSSLVQFPIHRPWLAGGTGPLRVKCLLFLLLNGYRRALGGLCFSSGNSWNWHLACSVY